MSSLSRAVLPVYNKYSSIMSHETRPYVTTPLSSQVIQPEKKVATSDVIPVVVKDATPVSDLVKIPLDLVDLATDDAADLEASSDPDDD